MKYPDDFDISAFPAGRGIALARFMAIGTLVSFLLILVSCFLLVWSMRSAVVKPYIISLDSRTGNWNTITLGERSGTQEITPEYAIQQSLVGRMVLYWFAISQNDSVNAAMWRRCDYNRDCIPGTNNLFYGTGECAIYCATDENLYSKFVNDVLPDYSARVESHDSWRVVPATIKVQPLSAVNNMGGTWQVYATVRSAMVGDMQVIAYVKVANNSEQYQQSSGFYISDFNAYRIN